MKIIAIGDKSRYQFLQSIVPAGELKVSSFKKEYLASTVYVVPFGRYNGENVFHSNMLPILTEIVFPSEVEYDRFECSDNDKVILFDEVPFRTQKKCDDLKLFAQKLGTDLCEVVLVWNNRKFMESDISTEEMAIEEADEKYKAEGFKVYRYTKGKLSDFLFGNGKPHIDQNIFIFKRRINQMKEKLQNFEIDYELEYELNMHSFFENPALLDSFFKYSRNEIRKDANKYFLNNAMMCFFMDRKNRYIDFYENIYLRYIEGICAWDLQKDLDILYRNVIYKFQQYFQDIPNLSCKEDEINYVIWCNQNMRYILEFKEKIKTFFENELCLIIKEQVLERIDKLEELLDEENN